MKNVIIFEHKQYLRMSNRLGLSSGQDFVKEFHHIYDVILVIDWGGVSPQLWYWDVIGRRGSLSFNTCHGEEAIHNELERLKKEYNN